MKKLKIASLILGLCTVCLLFTPATLLTVNDAHASDFKLAKSFKCKDANGNVYAYGSFCMLGGTACTPNGCPPAPGNGEQ